MSKGASHKLQGIKTGSFYNSIMKLGEIEGISVLCLNRQDQQKQHEVCATTLKDLFEAYKENFPEFSEWFWLYYFYKMPEVRNLISKPLDLLKILRGEF